MAHRCKKGGLAKRFYRGRLIGPGGLTCSCCADTKKRGKKKNKALGRHVKRVNRRAWKAEAEQAIAA